MDVLQEKMENYIKKITWQHEFTAPSKDNRDFAIEYNESKKRYTEKYAANLSTVFNEFVNETFIVTDNFEFSYLQEKVEIMKLLISVSFNIKLSEKKKYIGILNTFKKNIKYSNRRIDDIQKEILDIL
jgi:hypothetical protein